MGLHRGDCASSLWIHTWLKKMWHCSLLCNPTLGGQASPCRQINDDSDNSLGSTAAVQVLLLYFNFQAKVLLRKEACNIELRDFFFNADKDFSVYICPGPMKSWNAVWMLVKLQCHWVSFLFLFLFFFTMLSTPPDGSLLSNRSCRREEKTWAAVASRGSFITKATELLQSAVLREVGRVGRGVTVAVEDVTLCFSSRHTVIPEWLQSREAIMQM